MATRDLETAVGRFHLSERRLPRDVEELVSRGYLTGLPTPPTGQRYVLELSPVKLRLVKQESSRPPRDAESEPEL